MRSNFKNVKIGKKINIEKSLLNNQKISGHYVQGNVNSTAKVRNIDLINKTIDNSNTVFWNGPAGYYENKNFSTGSLSIAKKLPKIQNQSL